MNSKSIIKHLAIELFIYGILVSAYALIVLEFLSVQLNDMINENIVLYAFAGLVIIVLQGAFLERITSFLMVRLGLPHSE